jgi:ribosomal protein S18 acetylase RimI-like enzyme
MSRADLRPAGEEDLPFLYQLFCANRPELAGLPEPLLQMQFRAQSGGYGARFPGADHQIVVVEGRPIGQMLVAYLPAAIRLVDIALLPEAQGFFTGTQLVKDLQQRAAAAVKPLQLSVYETNPARRLYERLGFTITEQDGPRLQMTWDPPEV